MAKGRRACRGLHARFQRAVAVACQMMVVQFERADHVADIGAIGRRKIVHGFSL